MNTLHKLLAGGAAALALAAVGAVAAAPADGMPGEGMAQRMGMHRGPHGDPANMVQQHLARLKTDLKITAAQEAAWQTFAARAGERAQAMKTLHEQRQSAGKTTQTAPERMAQHVDAMRQQLAGMESLQGALKDLYAALTPEQRKLMDDHAARFGAGPGGPGGREGHGGPGMPQGPQG